MFILKVGPFLTGPNVQKLPFFFLSLQTRKPFFTEARSRTTLTRLLPPNRTPPAAALLRRRRSPPPPPPGLGSTSSPSVRKVNRALALTVRIRVCSLRGICSFLLPCELWDQIGLPPPPCESRLCSLRLPYQSSRLLAELRALPPFGSP